MEDGRWKMEDGRWKMEIQDFTFQNPRGERDLFKEGVLLGARMIISQELEEKFDC